MGQALFDVNNRAPTTTRPWLGLTNVPKIGGDQSPRPHMFRWTWFAWGCQWMAIYLQHKTKRPRESVNWSKFYGWRHKHFSRQKWNFQYFGLIFVHGDSNLSSSNVVFWLVFWQDFFFHFWMRERCLNFMLLNSKQAKCCLISHFL